MSAHELRTDLATLYAAADAAAAALAAGDPASRRALLRCLLREGMRHVSGGEAQLQPVPFEALQAALLRAAMADAQLSGFDANGPALPKLLHQLVSAGLVGWGGSTSGRRSVVALRADRLLEQLWQQRTAAGAAQPPPRTSALLPRGPHQSSDSGHAALHGQGIPRIPATFSLLGLTDHSCTIRLELTPNPAEQGQRARALTWLQAAVNSAVPGSSAAVRVQRGALRALLTGLTKTGSWSFRLNALPAVEAAAALQGDLAGHAGATGCFRRQYSSDVLWVLRAPTCSGLVELQEHSDGQTMVLLRIDRLAQAFIDAAGQPAQGPEEPAVAGAGWQDEQPAAPAHTPPRVTRSPRPASASVGGSPAAARSSKTTAAAAGLEQRQQRLVVVATETEAKAAAAQLCGAPEVALAFVWEPPSGSGSSSSSTAGGSQGSNADAAAAGSGSSVDGGEGSRVSGEASSSSSGAGTLLHVVLCGPGSPCFAFDLRAGDRAVASQLASVLGREQTTKVLHDGRSACAALLLVHGIRCASLWDTQVGFGLLQFICGLGALGGAGAAVEPPVGLDSLLGQYGLLAGSPRVAGGGGAAAVGSQPEETAQVAARLLSLKAQLEADLGPAASLRVEHLSRAWAEWCLPPAQRATATGAASSEQADVVRSGGSGGGNEADETEDGGLEDGSAWFAQLLHRAALY